MKCFRILCICVLTTIVFFYSSCNKNPVDRNDDHQINPRKLTWSIDTLSYPGSSQTWMWDIWGNSSNNVYVVGHNSSSHGNMYFFNGDKWMDVKLASSQGGIINGSFSLEAIHGFSNNHIWAVGDYDRYNPTPPPSSFEEGLLVNFDGKFWRQVLLPEPRSKTLFSVWGSAHDDVWFGGYDSMLYHFDGTSVKKDTLPISISKKIYRDQFISQITGNSSYGLYLMVTAYTNDGLQRNYLFERQSNSWVVLDTTFYPDVGILWMSDSGTLYAPGAGQIYKKLGTSWSNMVIGNLNINIGDINGTVDTNILIVGTAYTDTGITGRAYHFNGIDWFHIPQADLPDVSYNEVMIIKDSVFIVGDTNSGTPKKTIILQGK